MKINDVSLYERVYRKFHKPFVISEYVAEFSRFQYWRMKRDKDGINTLKQLKVSDDRVIQAIPVIELQELGAMISLGLRHPGIRIYAVYSNGTRRRIHMGRFRACHT